MADSSAVHSSHHPRVHPDDIIAAAAQGGAFRARQGRELYRWEQLREWETLGLIVREGRTLFRLANARTDLRSRLARAELAVGRPLIACRASAAEIFGFGVVDDGLLHVTTSSAQSIKSPVGVKIHQMSLRSPAVVIDGLTAVNPADTAMDIAASGRDIDVLVVLDAALRAGIDPGQLREAMARAKRMRGILRVRPLLPRANPLAESPMESRTRFRIYEAGLPEPELQVGVSTDSGGYRKLDLGWRRARLGLEFDGQDFHSGDGSLDRDRRRGAELISAGWTVIHVTGTDVYRSPGSFINLVGRLLRERGC